MYGGTPSPYGPQGQGGGYGGPAPRSQPNAWGAGAQQGYPTGGYPPPGYGAPGYSAPSYGAPRRTDNKAVIGLVLAISSWLICPVLPAIAALILAGQSNRAIDASGGALEGRTMNTATTWVSWLNIGLWVILLIVGAIFAGWALSQDWSVWNDWVDGSTEF